MFIQSYFVENDISQAKPKLIKQYLHSPAYFSCKSEYSVRWFYKKEKIPFHNVKVDEENRLYFSATELEHGGEYYCFGFDSAKQTYFVSRVFLIIIGMITRT